MRRLARHERLSAFLASCGDTELAALLDTGRANSMGVGGGSAVLDVQFAQIVIFLRSRKLPHMDGHFDNLRTDGV